MWESATDPVVIEDEGVYMLVEMTLKLKHACFLCKALVLEMGMAHFLL